MQVPSEPDVAGLLDRSMADELPGGRGLAAWQALLRSHATLMRQLERDLAKETGLALADFDVLAQLAGSSSYSSRDWTIGNSRFLKVHWRRSPSTARSAEKAGVAVQPEPDRPIGGAVGISPGIRPSARCPRCRVGLSVFARARS